MNAPCKGCEEREIGCHGHCAKYQEWNAWRQRELEAKAMRAREKPEYNRQSLKEYYNRLMGRRRK